MIIEPTHAEKLLSEALYKMTGDESHQDEVDETCSFLRQLADEIERGANFPRIGHTWGVFVVRACSLLEL